MSLRQKIFLVPFDFTDTAVKATKFALEIAKNEATKLVFVHENSIQNAGWNRSFEPYSDMLDEAEVPYEFVERSGDLVDVIIDTAMELKADMIVMGTEGNAGLTEDSNTSKVIERSSCSVLAVPSTSELNKIKKIAFACDFKDIKDSSALMELWFIALKMKAEVKIIFINKERKKHTELWNEEVEKTLEFYFHNLPHTYDIIDGDDFEVTLSDYTAREKIDLLSILPRNHKRNNQGESEGKLTKILALHSEIPLLAVD